MKFMGQSIGPAGIFYVMGCNELIERYEKGERTEDLYKKMIDLHSSGIIDDNLYALWIDQQLDLYNFDLPINIDNSKN